MSLLCSLFGHQPPVYAKKGWYSPGEEYATVRMGGTDGIGRVHAVVEGSCARCKKKFNLCRIHVPEMRQR